MAKKIKTLKKKQVRTLALLAFLLVALVAVLWGLKKTQLLSSWAAGETCNKIKADCIDNCERGGRGAGGGGPDGELGVRTSIESCKQGCRTEYKECKSGKTNFGGFGGSGGGGTD